MSQIILDGLTPAQRYYRKHKEKCKEAKKKCQKKNPDYNKEYYEKNKERINANAVQRRQNNLEKQRRREKEIRFERKMKVIQAYGGKCVCCGEYIPDFLNVDHINNDGAEERKKGLKGDKLFRYLITNNFPKNYQILCFNCNYSKFLNGGKCIHQIVKEQTE